MFKRILIIVVLVYAFTFRFFANPRVIENIIYYSNAPFRHVELLDLNIEVVEDSKVKITWITAREKDSDNFVLERSVDGENWEQIALIFNGRNSSSIKSYNFIDEHPYNIISFYRLSEFGLDDRQLKFPVFKIDLSDLITYTLQIFPNPSSGIFAVQSTPTELESLEIFDMFGRRIDISSLSMRVSNYKYMLDFSSQKAGVYFVRSKNFVTKLIKQ